MFSLKKLIIGTFQKRKFQLKIKNFNLELKKVHKNSEENYWKEEKTLGKNCHIIVLGGSIVSTSVRPCWQKFFGKKE